MSIECHYTQCQHHGTNEGDEGPFCHQQECTASFKQINAWSLQAMGYDLDELEKGNPYNQWMYES